MPIITLEKDQDAAEAIELCDEILDLIGDLPETAEAFGDSVNETVLSIKGTIERNDRVTDNQFQALVNMRRGVGRWLQQ